LNNPEFSVEVVDETVMYFWGEASGGMASIADSSTNPSNILCFNARLHGHYRPIDGHGAGEIAVPFQSCWKGADNVHRLAKILAFKRKEIEDFVPDDGIA
jgi:hypothetical protein